MHASHLDFSTKTFKKIKQLKHLDCIHVSFVQVCVCSIWRKLIAANKVLSSVFIDSHPSLEIHLKLKTTHQSGNSSNMI